MQANHHKEVKVILHKVAIRKVTNNRHQRRHSSNSRHHRKVFNSFFLSFFKENRLDAFVGIHSSPYFLSSSSFILLHLVTRFSFSLLPTLFQ
mmetsp:Transcript_9275/g.15467  ORF Transcript_9275/g.15467 Transcript_9275/m.15467 type:complete len:92 (+) Transcript_9275:3580-3855(+)